MTICEILLKLFKAFKSFLKLVQNSLLINQGPLAILKHHGSHVGFFKFQMHRVGLLGSKNVFSNIDSFISDCIEFKFQHLYTSADVFSVFSLLFIFLRSSSILLDTSLTTSNPFTLSLLSLSTSPSCWSSPACSSQ